MLIFFNSCTKEEDFVKSNTTLESFSIEQSDQKQSSLLDFALEQYNQGVDEVTIYSNVLNEFQKEPIISANDFQYWISKTQSTDSFSELIEDAFEKELVTKNELLFLEQYDELVFVDLNTIDLLLNLNVLDQQITQSDIFTESERSNLLTLNQSLVCGLTYNAENNVLARGNGWLCGAGILVTFTSGFLAPNPLGVIAGGLIIKNYC